jgi:hypothetical protein
MLEEDQDLIPPTEEEQRATSLRAVEALVARFKQYPSGFSDKEIEFWENLRDDRLRRVFSDEGIEQDPQLKGHPFSQRTLAWLMRSPRKFPSRPLTKELIRKVRLGHSRWLKASQENSKKVQG